MLNWKMISVNPPPHGIEVMTKIHDERGCRNEQPMRMTQRTPESRQMWWTGDMYVYYTPTHWAEMPE